MSEMRKLFNKYKCDKGHKHGYEEVYEKNFEKLKNEKINILELGIFKGASTEAWVDYFPNATIYGIDIFKRLDPKTVPILNHERVKWIKGDSLKSSIAKQIEKEWGDVRFDIIIDDGMHTPDANRISFQHLNPFLKDDGAYFIEDVFPIDIMSQKEMSIEWIVRRGESYNMFNYMMFLNSLDGWQIKKYDLRKKSGEPDSYIFRLKK